MIRETGSPWVGFAGVGLVAAVIGSAFVLRGTLETRRPDQEAEIGETVAANEVVPARLWQDPLYAIQTHWDAVSRPEGSDETTSSAPRPRRPEPLTIGAMRKGMRKQLSSCDAPDCSTAGEQASSESLLLVFPLAGEPYAEDSENRRRRRHAVVSALTENDYVPEEAARLGYFTAPCFDEDCDGSSSGSTEAGSGRRIRIGFEVFEGAIENPDSHWKSIHVLWLNAGDFRSCLLYRVAALAAFLDEHGPKSASARTVLIGPTTSGALGELGPPESEGGCLESAWKWWRRLELEDKDRDARSCWSKSRTSQGGCKPIEARIMKRRARLRILSPGATVPLELLFAEAGKKMGVSLKARSIKDAWDADDRLAKYLKVGSFNSVVARDDVVLGALLDELLVRGASRPLIAIVSEQDSAYGRLLDDVVEGLVDENRMRGRMEGFKVAEYGYLAGVDGETPPLMSERKRREGSEERTAGGPDSRGRNSIIRRGHEEQAFGAQQLDYVRRLADHIVRDLGTQAEEGGLGAGLGSPRREVVVGVLGSDVYDKLLIIQALRDRLPTATFFTTDLDARLAHPEVFPRTRNLIVGSPYGLTVESLKGAPFRDSYQTATFRAVALALHRQFPDGGLAPPPRLFEIGRNGAVAITQHPATRSEETREAPWASEEVHGDVLYDPSRRFVLRRLGEWLVVLAPLLVLVVFAMATRRSLSGKTAHLRRRARGDVAYAGAAMIALSVLAGWGLAGHEPRPLLEGVNSLPTLVLYLTTLVYAYAAVAIGAARLKQAERAFQEEWDLPCRRGRSFRRIKGRAGRRGPLWLSSWKQDVSRTTTKMPKKEAKKCWEQYLTYVARSERIARVSVPIIASLIIVVVVVFLVWPPAPLLTRSYPNLVKWVGVFTTVGVVGAVCFCDDVLRLGRVLIREIGRHEVVGWPKVKRGDHVGQHWRTMRFLELYTDSVMPLAALPFVLLALLIFARSPLFEGWVWTGQILLLFAGLVVYVATRALLFQLEAVRAKNAIVWCLDRLHFDRVGKSDEKKVAAQVEIVKERIGDIRRGAFGPWIRHPIAQALLLPSLTYGLVLFLESAL